MVRLKPAPPVIWMVSFGATGTMPWMVPLTAWANAPPANPNETVPPIAKASALRWNMRLREARRDLQLIGRPLSPARRCDARLVSPHNDFGRPHPITFGGQCRRKWSALPLVAVRLES